MLVAATSAHRSAHSTQHIPHPAQHLRSVLIPPTRTGSGAAGCVTRGPIRPQQEALTLEEGQAGVELPGAVAEGQCVVLGPGVSAGGSCHMVLFQQNCNHLPKTVSARVNKLPAHFTHVSQELLPAWHQGSDRYKDTVLQAQQGNSSSGSWDLRALAMVHGRDSAKVQGRRHVTHRP